MVVLIGAQTDDRRMGGARQRIARRMQRRRWTQRRSYKRTRGWHARGLSRVRRRRRRPHGHTSGTTDRAGGCVLCFVRCQARAWSDVRRIWAKRHERAHRGYPTPSAPNSHARSGWQPGRVAVAVAAHWEPVRVRTHMPRVSVSRRSLGYLMKSPAGQAAHVCQKRW